MYLIRRTTKHFTKLLSLRPLLVKLPIQSFSNRLDEEGSDSDFQSKTKTKSDAQAATSKAFEIEFDADMNVDALHAKLAGIVKENKIVLFMKGSPQMPQCGYSRLLAETLKYYQIPEFAFVNILTSNQLRTEVKKFSDWQTFPQLYVGAELIGGSDIVMELHKDGALEDILKGDN